LPALLAACFFYYPYAFDGPVLCPTALTLGLPCPGCGLTRATSLLTHGHVGEALAFHPLAPFLLLYAAFLWAYKVVESARGRPPELPTATIGGAACLIVVGFWFVRLGVFFAQGGAAVMARDNLVARIVRLLS
jgi:hypothetical protein